MKNLSYLILFRLKITNRSSAYCPLFEDYKLTEISDYTTANGTTEADAVGAPGSTLAIRMRNIRACVRNLQAE